MNNDQVEGPDIISEGWHLIDDRYISRRPPKIKWGRGYLDQTSEEKIAYLEKFANTMNHAAALVQDERNELNNLCELKEKQLRSMAQQVEVNNQTLVAEVTRMNEQRQEYNNTIKELNKKIRELE